MSTSYRYKFLVIVSAAFLCIPFIGNCADEDAISFEDQQAEEEVAYVKALVEANMPDFAEPVIAAAKKKWPKLAPQLKVLELQGQLRLGKFDEVQKVVNSMTAKNSEYWALRLAMADAYYARGMLPECRNIYREFFNTVTKPGNDIINFYVESGFRWAQMCVLEHNYDEAIKMYGELLSKPLPEMRWCAVAMEDVDLLLRLASEIRPDDTKRSAKREQYLNQANKLADQLLWKNELIIVFGKAVAMKAHIEMLRGAPEKAQTLVTDYMPQLSEIHKSLVEQDKDGSQGFVRMSPMPECRYLLAKVLWEGVQEELKNSKPNDNMIRDSLFGPKVGGKRNGTGAYNHAINVFVKYPESSWAASAGELVTTIEKFVKERYGKTIRTTVTAEQKRKVRKMQFQNAYNMYKGGEYDKAVKVYGEILAQFPEVDESVDSVSVLAECYLNLWDREKDAARKLEMRLSADAVEGYLVERFSGLKETWQRSAGDAVLRLAAKEAELGQIARQQQLYDMYFHYLPTHYNASQLALTLAQKASLKEDWEKAAQFYTLVATVFTNSTHYATALQQLSSCYSKMGNEVEQLKWLRKFAQVTTSISDRSTAHLQLALMQQKRGFADFDRAAETNDVEAAEAIRKAAYLSVAGAIRDFRKVSDSITKELADNHGLPKVEEEKFQLRREQAMFLEGDGWQRLSWPAEKVSVFRKQAVNAYERYLKMYPKGQYGSVALVKIGTIHTAEKNMEASQNAFSRLQRDFPESDEAKNSVPRLAKTLIEMGLRQEGVAQYKQMLETKDGKYSAAQFLQAGDALLAAKGWDVATDAYQQSIELAKALTNATAKLYITANAQLGMAKASFGQKMYADAHQKLDAFVEKNSKSTLVVEAYEMLVEVASEEGRVEKDDNQRMLDFNAAVNANKKLRGYKKDDKAAQDLLDLRSADIQVRKMEAEEAMNLKEKAEESCRAAVAAFQAFLMGHEPTAEHPAKDMTPAQLANLERCYGTVLPLMAKLGKEQSEMILTYGAVYQELFPNGKHKTDVQNALNQARADR